MTRVGWYILSVLLVLQLLNLWRLHTSRLAPRTAGPIIIVQPAEPRAPVHTPDGLMLGSSQDLRYYYPVKKGRLTP